MVKITEGVKETLRVETIIMVLVAWVGYALARLVHSTLFSRVDFLKRYPEVSDLAVMVIGATFLRGSNSLAFVVGSGLALLNDLATRLNLPFLKVQ